LPVHESRCKEVIFHRREDVRATDCASPQTIHVDRGADLEINGGRTVGFSWVVHDGATRGPGGTTDL
jgi:hypothetical protein